MLPLVACSTAGNNMKGRCVMFANVTPGAEFVFYGLLVLTALVYLWLLVKNPDAADKMAKRGQEQQKQSFDLMGKAVKGGASLWKLFKRK